MNEIKLDNICFSDNTRILNHYNEIVIGNVRECGLWIKILTKDFEKIKTYIGLENGFELLMRNTDNARKQYYIEIIKALAKIKAIKRKDWSENKKTIERLDIELTTKCNLRCKHCSGEYGEQDKSSMPQEMFHRIIHWAAENNISSVTLSGGEIFCLSNISKYLEYARKNFMGRIDIISNATLIYPEHISILKSCVDEISISLDGYDKNSVDFIRGQGVFDKVIETIILLKNNKIDNISLSMVLTSNNKNHVTDFKELCNKFEVKPILRTLSVKGRALKFYDDLINDNEKGKEDNISKRINMLAMCNAGSQILSINASGKVTLCSAMEESNVILGDIDELDIIFHDVKRINTICVVDTVTPCNECDVRYFCSSMCHAVNTNIYNNNQLKEKRCEQYKNLLEKHVWGI